jgi:predicted nucleic acid-binding protein
LKIALDTSVLIEFLFARSPRREATWACYQAHRLEGAEFVIAEHALLETFSVLSRSPRALRMPAAEAERLMLAAFGKATIAPVRNVLAWETIRHTLARGHWGGRVYDAIIALAVFDAGATVLLTWDVADFLFIAPPGLEVRQPA